MKYEIITLENVQIIGMVKEIAFCKGQEECPKFWGEYVERIIKPELWNTRFQTHFSRQPSTMVSESSGSAPATLPARPLGTLAKARTIIVQPVGRQTLVLAARTPLHTSSAEYIKVVGCPRE